MKTLLKLFVVFLVTYSALSFPVSEDLEVESVFNYETSTVKVKSATEDFEINFMALSFACGLLLVIILSFVISAFYCGCAYLTCGMSLNQPYQPI